MVIKMRKLGVLLHHSDRDSFLAKLQSLGLVHVSLSSGENATALESLMEERRLFTKAATGLASKVISETVKSSPLAAEKAVELFTAAEKKGLLIEQQEGKLKKEREALLPWGNFDPTVIERLEMAGTFVRLFEAAPKIFDALDLKGKAVEIISRDGQRVLFALVEIGEKSVIPLEPVRLPAKSLLSVETELKHLAAEKESLEKEKLSLVASLPAINKAIEALDEKIDLESVKVGLTTSVEGKILFLRGFFPADSEDNVRSFLAGHSAYFTVEDPIEGDPVPIALRNNAFVKLFEPITKIFALPDYFEFDPTPFFAPFFTLFVGLCLGDIGYGAILLILSFFLVKKGSTSMKPMGMLIMVLAVSTILGGFLLNSFFGHTFFTGTGVAGGYFDVGDKITYYAPLSSVETPSGTDFPAMRFAMTLGFVQLLFAMLLKGIMRIQTKGFLFGLQSFSYIFMVIGGLVWGAHANPLNLGIAEFTVGPLNIGALLFAPSALAGKALLIFGLAVFMVFNNPDKPFLTRFLGLSLWEMYGFATGILGDILSYLRIFALGLASGLLGNAFNYIAFMLVTGPDGTAHYASPMIIFTILILLVGHGLNLALSMIGSFVHPLRLTFVEFYKNIDFKGGGTAYKPFATAKLRENN